MVATLIRMTGDWDLAEECAQDAFAVALERWPRDGVPLRPGAWLTTTARNRALDRLRRGATEAAKLREGAALWPSDEPDPNDEPDEGDGDDGTVGDDRLRLIFTCCHPALPLEARVALTLRTLAGLTTAEIARALLVSEPTMAKRLVRAKGKIRNAAIPYRVPPAHLLPERTGGVLAVLYLLFNEGYAASAGTDLVRHDLCAEAIRLARALAVLMPDEPEALGLLALMLLHHARRAARMDDAGDIVTLEDQDRALWDTTEIGEGLGLLDTALRQDRAGPYQLQASIAACHCRRRGRRGHRLGADRPAVWAARPAGAVRGGRAQPRSCGGDGRRPRCRTEAGAGAGSLRRSGRLPPAPRHARRSAAPPRAARRGGRRLSRGARVGGHRGRAPLPDPTADRGRTGVTYALSAAGKAPAWPKCSICPMCDRAPHGTMQGMSAQAWWRLLKGPTKDPTTGAERAPHGGGRRLTIRWATPDDAVALARLAQVDSSRPPRGVVLLAEVGDELWAAISLDDGHLVADPFRLSGELAFDLAQRARRVKRAERGRMGRLPRVFPAGADGSALLAG